MTAGKRWIPKFRRDIPSPPSGWFDVTYSIAWDGALSCLRSNSEVASALAHRRELQSQVWESIPDDIAAEISKPLFPSNALAKICVVGDASDVQTDDFLLEYPFPLFDRLPGGHWIMANARCEFGLQNARVFDQRGCLQTRLCLGDGIKHLQCDQIGKIWVGYFDEGVFGSFGWGLPDVPPLGASGLVQFDATGKVDWSYKPSNPEGPWIADCYSLNVSTEGVWCCTNMEFPILRVSTGGPNRAWVNEIAGAEAIAVQGNHLALLGGYGDDESRLAFLQFGTEKAEPVALFDLDIGNLRHADLVAGRGDTLHVVANRSWYKISVSELLAVASSYA